jgi:hypothetical protein
LCSEEALPEDIKKGGSVKKGTVIAFARDGKGSVRAWANQHDLVEVHSEKLAQAVFDIYLGETVTFASPFGLHVHFYHFSLYVTIQDSVLTVQIFFLHSDVRIHVIFHICPYLSAIPSRK